MKHLILLLIGWILKAIVYLLFVIPMVYFSIKWFMFSNMYLYNLDWYWLFKLPIYLIAILINIAPLFIGVYLILFIQKKIKEKLPMFYKP